MAEGGVTRVPSTPDVLVISGPFHTLSPDLMYRYWTEPQLLCRWWPHEAETDARPGGSYHLSWPGMNWNLRGRYTDVDPGRRLGFTWKWDHELTSDRTVEIEFQPLGDGGTMLLLRHGTYIDSPQDAEERESHAAGWLHFLGRLYVQAPDLNKT